MSSASGWPQLQQNPALSLGAFSPPLSLRELLTVYVHTHCNSPLSAIVMAVVLLLILISREDASWTTLSPARLSQF